MVEIEHDELASMGAGVLRFDSLVAASCIVAQWGIRPATYGI